MRNLQLEPRRRGHVETLTLFDVEMMEGRRVSRSPSPISGSATKAKNIKGKGGG